MRTKEAIFEGITEVGRRYQKKRDPENMPMTAHMPVLINSINLLLEVLIDIRDNLISIDNIKNDDTTPLI